MNEVKIGSKITVKFDDGEEVVLQIVNCHNVDVSSGKISADAPFAKAMIGKKEGIRVKYLNSLQKPVDCKILKVF